jgi:hypothetical protein
MALEVDGAIMIVLTIENDIWGGITRGQTFLKSDFRSWVKFFGRSKPVIHCPIFILNKKWSQVSLFKQWTPINNIINNFIYSFNQCLPQQRRQKCLLAFPSIITRMINPRWRRQKTSCGISYVTNKSPSARNIVVAFYPWVISSVVFILPQGRRWLWNRLVDDKFLLGYSIA